MQLVLYMYQALCKPSVFEINGRQADYEDFGVQRDIDNDPEILYDYNIKGNTPAFIIFDDDGNRILTHCGRFSESKIIKLLTDLKNNSNFN